MRDNHLRILDNWRQAFQELQQRRDPSEVRQKKGRMDQSQRSDAGLSAMLWTSYWAAFIALSASLDADECFYDRFSAEFSHLIQRAERLVVLRLRGETEAGYHSTFTPQIAVIQPLYFTALKCRNKDPRARAVTLPKSVVKRA